MRFGADVLLPVISHRLLEASMGRAVSVSQVKSGLDGRRTGWEPRGRTNVAVEPASADGGWI